MYRGESVYSCASSARTTTAAGLLLVAAHRPRRVGCAARHGVGGAPESLRAGGAEVLDPADGLVLELERSRERHARHPRHGGAEPVRVDVILGHAGGGKRLLG